MEQGEIGSRGKQLMMGVVLEDSEEFLVSIIKKWLSMNSQSLQVYSLNKYIYKLKSSEMYSIYILVLQ